jgi:hypothetical protein
MLKALFRFFQFSCVSFLTSFGLTLALHEWGQLPEEAAFAMALVVVLVLNFVLMRSYVYEAKTGTILKQFGLYLCSAGAFRAAEYSAFLVWHTWWGSDYRLALVGITGISAGLKFFYYRMLFERGGRLPMRLRLSRIHPATPADDP